MAKLKIAIIGAGSATFGRGTITDLLASEELNNFELILSLVDIDSVSLKRMLKLANLLKTHFHSSAIIEATTDRCEALQGAKYVISSVAKKRWDLWEKDYYIPLAYGFRHILGENGGPGAAFHTLRSLNLMIPICQDMERICPEALLLNFTNPESRVCLGISKLTNVRTVGLCHGPIATMNRIAEILDRRPEDIDVVLAGINHFHWALQIRDRVSGEDLYPALHSCIEEVDWDIDTLNPLMLKFFGVIGYPAPSHPGEFLHFAHEIVGPQLLKWGLGGVSRKLSAKVSDCDYVIEHQSRQSSSHLRSIERTKVIDKILTGQEPLSGEFVQTTKELTVPIIRNIELNLNRTEVAANVENIDFAVENLPEDAIVEVPIRVNGDGVHPVKVGRLPEAIAGMCSIQISIQKLLVEAYRQRSKHLLLQAILIDPLVDSVTRAQEMVEFMLKAQEEYLPELN